MLTGNTDLSDLGNVLSIELGATGGTYVADNPSLCIEAPSATWSQRSNSYISYNTSQCGSGYLCPLFSVGGDCVSSCSTCGTLCEPIPITDINSMTLYKTKGCTSVAGDLYIQNLPTSILKKHLLINLQAITHIKGTLYLINCPVITSLSFFPNLVELYGGAYINNVNLVDARLPALTTLLSPVVVEGCNRLCPARYTIVGAGGDDSGCPNIRAEFFYNIQGAATIADLPSFSSILTRAITNLTGNSWQSKTTTTMIEAGPRWMSVEAQTTNISASTFFVALVSPLINNHQLPLYAVTDAEKAFLQSNTIALSYSAFLIAEETGYNSGNTFSGAKCACV